LTQSRDLILWRIPKNQTTGTYGPWVDLAHLGDTIALSMVVSRKGNVEIILPPGAAGCGFVPSGDLSTVFDLKGGSEGCAFDGLLGNQAQVSEYAFDLNEN